MNEIYKTEEGREKVLQEYRKILANWPVENKQYHVDTSFGSTFIIESGNINNPPLILIHGSTANSFTWFGDVSTFSETHRVFVIDIIGEAGLSDPSRPSYQSGDYSKWIAEILHKLELEKASLVGISLGGWMVLSFATTYPEKVNKIGLICPAGIYREKRSFIFKAIFYLLCGSWGKKQIIKIVNGGKLPSSKGMEKAMEFIVLISQHFKPRMAKLLIFSDKALSNLTMPIQIIFGEFDYLVPAEESIDRLNSLAPNVESILLADTGHAISNQAGCIQKFLIKNQ